MKSGNVQRDLERPVAVRQCPVRAGAPWRSPAVPSAIWSCQMQFGNAQCDQSSFPFKSFLLVWSLVFRSKSPLFVSRPFVSSPLFRWKSSLRFKSALFVRSPLFCFESSLSFQILSSPWKSCLLFEVSSVRFKASLLYRILSFVGSPLFVSRRLFCFEFSLSLEVLSFVGSPLFVSNPLCH